jgi:hypothetical protein
MKEAAHISLSSQAACSLRARTRFSLLAFHLLGLLREEMRRAYDQLQFQLPKEVHLWE